MVEKYKAPPAEMKELAKGVYAFLQPGGGYTSNSGLIVGKNWATVIDSQTNKYQIENFISLMKKITEKPVRVLLNTHYHPDHTFTNYYFPEAVAITTRPNFRETTRLNPSMLPTLKKMMPEPLMSYDGSKIFPQDLIFEGKLTVYDGIREIDFIDLGPAHAPSDIIAYLPKEKIVYGGDIVGSGGAPGATSVMDGSYRMIEVMSTLSNMDAERFVPGHGPRIMSREEVIQTASPIIDFLLIMREEARKCFNKGMTYQEAVEKIDYSKFTKWGDKKSLYGLIYGNCARAWSEFKGEPLDTTLDQEEMRAKGGRPGPDGKYPDRIDLGYSRPEPW